MAKQLRKYRVSITVGGNCGRNVEAASEEEAIQKVKKLLLAECGQQPKSGKLDAFTWDFPHVYGQPHWSDMTEEELEEHEAKVEKLKKRFSQPEPEATIQPTETQEVTP